MGFFGSIYDVRVLRLSGIFDFVENEEILLVLIRMVYGGLLRLMLVGDSVYFLKNWLIKFFVNRGRFTF